jgi:arylsulfatase A-like enzyme
VDRTVGELRRKLENAGLWDSTTIFITADHGLRYELWHGGMNWSAQLDRLLENGQSATVPFILKLGGQKTPAVYDAEFSSVVAGDLNLAVLRGDITKTTQVGPWLEGNVNPPHITAKR